MVQVQITYYQTKNYKTYSKTLLRLRQQTNNFERSNVNNYSAAKGQICISYLSKEWKMFVPLRWKYCPCHILAHQQRTHRLYDRGSSGSSAHSPHPKLRMSSRHCLLAAANKDIQVMPTIIAAPVNCSVVLSLVLNKTVLLPTHIPHAHSFSKSKTLMQVQGQTPLWRLYVHIYLIQSFWVARIEKTIQWSLLKSHE